MTARLRLLSGVDRPEIRQRAARDDDGYLACLSSAAWSAT
jgi:hypothetical protein